MKCPLCGTSTALIPSFHERMGRWWCGSLHGKPRGCGHMWLTNGSREMDMKIEEMRQDDETWARVVFMGAAE